MSLTTDNSPQNQNLSLLFLSPLLYTFLEFSTPTKVARGNDKETFT